MLQTTSLIFVVVVATLSLVAATAADPLPGISALIQSCGGWALNKLPELKSFLKEPDGVDLYKKVEVEFIPGRKAVMTIYQDGAEIEKITLSDYNDKEKLHELFIEKGFEKYNEEELAEIRKMKQEVEEANEKEATKRLRGNINQLTKPMTGGKISTKMLKDYLSVAGNLNKAQQKAAVKEKIKELKQARDNYMMIGMPDDRPKAKESSR